MTYRKYIYVIGHPDSTLVKIGRSMSPHSRIKELRTPGNCAVPPGLDCTTLELLAHWRGNADIEKWLHRRFSADRTWGAWFNLGPDAVPTIEAALAKLPRHLHTLATREDDDGPPPTRRQATPIRGRR